MSSMERRRDRDVESPTAHGYQADKRLEFYAWVERELLRPQRRRGRFAGDARAARNPPGRAPPREQDVLRRLSRMDRRDPGSSRPRDREEAAASRETRPALAKKLGLPSGLEAATVRDVREAGTDGVRAGFYAMETEPG